MAPKKNWLIVYTDDEGDMMLVGDDPWQYVLMLLSFENAFLGCFGAIRF